MIRISKLTDYGIALMTQIAREHGPGSFTARDLAGELGLPLPTVSKLLKQLARSELLSSQRGAHGGYQLTTSPAEITVAQLIDALEGPIAMTECTGEAHDSACDFETFCGVRGNWQWINRRVQEALASVTLAEMAGSVKRRADETMRDLRDRSLEMKKQ